MTFHDPAAFVSLLAIPIVILFHLIRKNRETIRVSSLLLWRAPGPERKRVVIRRLFANPSLLLQLLVVTLLAVALADPSVPSRRVANERRVVVVLDGSASMQARSAGRTRFELAQDATLGLLGSLAPSGKMMVIEAAAHPTVLVPFTSDRAAVTRAVRESRPTDEPLDIASALRLAGRVAVSGTEIALVSDGAFDAPASINSATARLRFIRVGDPVRNVAITAFSIRPTVNDPAVKEILLTVDNFEDSTVTTTARILLDGAAIATRELTLGAGEARSLIFRYTAHDALRAEAVLDVNDDLAVDNRAFAVLRGGAPVRVLLVSRGNFFLTQLLAVMPQVTADEAPVYDGQSGYDVVILDRVAPPPLDAGSFLVIDTPIPDSPFDPTAYVAGPEITGQDRSNPLVSGFDLTNINLKEALATPASREIQSLLTSHAIPLVATYSTGALRIFYVGFDLLASDLPLRPAFPLLMANAIGWLAPSKSANAASWVQAGTPIELHAPAGSYPLTVHRPDGTTETLEGPTFSNDDLVGFYRFEGKGYQNDVAVDLASSAESNLLARFAPGAAAYVTLTSSTAATAAPTAGAPAASAGGAPRAIPSITGEASARPAPARGVLSLVPLLLVLAALVLAGEWYLWVRRWRP